MTEREKKPIRIVVLGDGGVGKTCLTLVFMYDEFVNDYEPTKADIFCKKLQLDGRTYDLDILDTAGQEDYASIRDANMRSGNVFVVVFSVTSRVSFENTRDIRDQILRVRGTEECHILLVGNKLDLVETDPTLRQITKTEAESRASQWGVQYIEASAKTKVNVQNIFNSCVKCVCGDTTQAPVSVSKPAKKKKKFCSIL